AKIAVAFRDSAIGLTPHEMSSKALVVLTDASLLSSVENKKGHATSVNVKKASVLITNDVRRLNSTSGKAEDNLYFDESDHLQRLTQSGYVLASYMSSASATIKTSQLQSGLERSTDVEL